MILAIIQARMGSTRLPGKVLKKVLGRTLLEHLILRVKRARGLDKIVVATTMNKEDAPIAKLAKSLGVGAYRGSVDDVLDRYYQAAKEAKAKTIVRLTGDCPVMDPGVIDRCVNFYEKNHFDYVSNANPPTFPDGMDVEVFSFSVLEKTWRQAKRTSEREHVTPFMRNSGSFKTANIKNRVDMSCLRLTVDEKRDMLFIEKIMNSFAKQHKPNFGLKEITAMWQKDPDFFLDNKGIKRNEGYEKSLEGDRTLFLRKATESDARFLYDLRNEEVVRQASFSTDVIPFEEHARWFQKKLAGTDSVIFIVEIGGVPAGQVRFDFRADKEAEISIAINGAYRGKGYASDILKSAAGHLFTAFPKAHRIHAFIKPTNEASLKVFAEAGYRHIGKRRVKGESCIEMMLTR